MLHQEPAHVWGAYAGKGALVTLLTLATTPHVEGPVTHIVTSCSATLPALDYKKDWQAADVQFATDHTQVGRDRGRVRRRLQIVKQVV